MQQIKDTRVRPLGISSFPDKVVQENIRIVLNAIYKPEFAKQNLNKGFRLKYGCVDAILAIQTKAKAMDYCIEGDIKGAYDNVNHEILMQHLKNWKNMRYYNQ
jgi:retron-type reverse transcriptase